MPLFRKEDHKLKLITTTKFYDIENDKTREINEEFDAKEERAKKLLGLGYVKEVKADAKKGNCTGATEVIQ